MLTTLLLYLVLGGFAGLIAGLLGVGGGLVIVPIVSFSLTAMGMPEEHIMHLALGTSLATIIFTSISSYRAHDRRGAVRWDVFKAISPGIIVGTFIGAWFASLLPTSVLKAGFVAFLYYVSVQMLLDMKPKASRELPHTVGMTGAGCGIGCISSMVGIGGGTLSVPFMLFCNVPMHVAIGTSSAIGLPIAVSGALGYMINGWSMPGLPAYSFGYIYIPALLGIVSASVLTAPLGARLAHSLPVRKLKRIFAALLVVVATRMLMSLI